MNPCPCGYLGDLRGNCGCSAERVANYRGKISGPLLDRIDLHVEVGRPAHECLRGGASQSASSATVQARVCAAHRRQITRAGRCNARLDGKAIERTCTLDKAGWRLLDAAAERFALSARSYQRVLRVARTIADLAGVETITPPQLAEALNLRGLDSGRNG
jgi:magnesium chelatase family protein